jgi:hypothetical protein
MTKRRIVELEQELTLEQRRRFLKLPIEQRRSQMQQQAAQVAQHYESAGQIDEREQWQGGDLVEPF